MMMLAKILRDRPEIWDGVIPHSMTEKEIAEDLKGLTTKQRYAYVVFLETAAQIAANNVEIAKKTLGEIEKPDPNPWKSVPS
jgi:hypothetical protein